MKQKNIPLAFNNEIYIDKGMEEMILILITTIIIIIIIIKAFVKIIRVLPNHLHVKTDIIKGKFKAVESTSYNV